MKIYTKTGDKGETSLIYGTRVPKNHPRVDAYGTLDEANAAIGTAISLLTVENDSLRESLQRVQTLLFHAGAELATPPDKRVQWKLESKHTSSLEADIDRWSGNLPPLKQFILPGGCPSSAALHQARTIVRRAERLIVALSEVDRSGETLPFINRLSDYLFVAARYANHLQGTEETPLVPDI
ncbi:cob(I)yrinic acid a,c-diamide adenosyltransferase [Terribacillus sp. 179-K 1B1 HS]|uniref:cob(I)yrinic acid a,c-diamide adenosyltransferase n=1 Tax=Terribacillus sp. 179-K 1B1 HS TaxID=3142388 RepID=UPI00399F803E